MAMDLLLAAVVGGATGLLALGIVEAAAYLDDGETLVAETVAEQAYETREGDDG